MSPFVETLRIILHRAAVAFAFALAMTAPPAAAEPFTLDEALAVALQSHPVTVEAAENLAAAEARIGQAKAGYYPQVSLVADGAKARTYFPMLADSQRADVFTHSLVVKQLLFDFGRSAGAVETAAGLRAASAETLSLTREDVALRVKTAYYALLGAERDVAAHEAAVAAREALFRQATEFYREGVRPKVDVTKAEANLFAARTAFLQSESVRDLARVELADAVGLPSLGDRIVAPVGGGAGLPLNLGELQSEAWRTRRELKRLEALKAAGEGALKSVRAEYLPVLAGAATYGLSAEEMPPDRRVWSLGVSVTVPLFSGFSTREKGRETEAGLRALSAQVQNAKLAIGKEVAAAWLAARDASARVTSTSKEAAAAQETQTLAQERYREGVGTVIEVTDAQAQTLAAQTANIRATFDYLTALARLDRAVGANPKPGDRRVL